MKEWHEKKMHSLEDINKLHDQIGQLFLSDLSDFQAVSATMISSVPDNISQDLQQLVNKCDDILEKQVRCKADLKTLTEMWEGLVVNDKY